MFTPELSLSLICLSNLRIRVLVNYMYELLNFTFMKKARIILSIIIIFAITGGMLAFKVQRFGVVTYYFCTTAFQTCSSSWTYGGWISTVYDPLANVTISNAVTTTTAFNKPCAQNCTWSNTVWIEPGF